jgi:hypothetical protein
MLDADERTWRELAAAEPIRIPACARSLFTAHLAYRHQTGAASTDPYFAHPRDPAGKAATENLWAAAEAALKQAGLIYSSTGPDEVHVSDDVRFSLRYSDDDHIARELGEARH